MFLILLEFRGNSLYFLLKDNGLESLPLKMHRLCCIDDLRLGNTNTRKESKSPIESVIFSVTHSDSSWFWGESQIWYSDFQLVEKMHRKTYILQLPKIKY